MSTVAFIGLGKLGLPVAEAMAEFGHDVCGYDINPDIRSTSVPLCRSYKVAVRQAEFVFIAVPTPHHVDYDGSKPSSHLPVKDFGYTMVEEAILGIRPYLRDDATVVIISTCLPGTTEARFAPLLPDHQLIYNPYFIAMGSVRRDFLDPEFMLIGSADATGGDKLIHYYKTILGEDVSFCKMTWNEAECTKVFYNTWISWKLSFVNMIQDVAESIGNMNVDVVTEALCKGNQRLISDRYMTAGMGDGGPCHPRDNIALSFLAERLGLDYDLFGAIMQSRESQAEALAYELEGYVDRHGIEREEVVIVGKAFKPGVQFVDGSYSLLIAHYLEQVGIKVMYIDPCTGDEGPDDGKARVYLMAHGSAYGTKFPSGSVIVDPWRTMGEMEDVTVISYGNTRARR